MTEEDNFLEIARQSLSADDWKAVVLAAITEAKQGDAKARDFIASFCLPKDRDSGVGGKVKEVRFVVVPKEDQKVE